MAQNSKTYFGDLGFGGLSGFGTQTSFGGFGSNPNFNVIRPRMFLPVRRSTSGRGHEEPFKPCRSKSCGCTGCGSNNVDTGRK